MRFSSGAPTTPTTTTSIDLIDNAQGKRGSNSGMQASTINAPIQIVEVENAQQQLNGGTASHQEVPQPQTPASDKLQQSIVVAISTSYGGSDGSQTLPDDDGNV